MSELYYQTLRERFSPKPAPKCSVCGEEMSMQRISGSHVVYACSGMEDDGCFKTGRTYADEHYKKSRITVVDDSDPDVIELLDENVEMALTLENLRVELEGKDKLIAELRKQCAEWERKAFSNFEECAAMADRIEYMSKQSCEARERDLFESWVMHSICISKSTLEGLRTETGYRNATLSGTDFNRMWEQWKSIRAAGIRIKGE
ncbi:ead/Ea22-like family protein [Escherichia coli]|nr:hypothetical protein [Escherichia coli]